MKSNKTILDFSDCKYLGQVYKIIKDELNFPSWAGENLDALWDCLTGIVKIDANIEIVYKPKTKSASNLGVEIDKIISVFLEAQEEYGEISVSVER